MALQDVLAIEKPIIQAPMAGVQDWRMAVAVSNAGALGSIPCGMLNVEQVLAEISQFKAHSQKPYCLNFFCHDIPKPELQARALERWHECLADYYKEFNVEPAVNSAGLRRPFDGAFAEALAAIKPPLMSFHFGLPCPSLLAEVKSWGTVVLSTATTLAEALWLQAKGVDAIIVQGVEAGGHRGMFLAEDMSAQLPTLELLKRLQPLLKVPLIAAGGIATHADVQEMLDAGAEAVQLGTSFLLCHEAKTSAVHRQAIASEDLSTAISNVFSGRLARGVSNRLMRELDYISEHAPTFPYAALALGPLRSAAETRGLADFSPLWAGVHRHGCAAISAADMVERLWPKV